LAKCLVVSIPTICRETWSCICLGRSLSLCDDRCLRWCCYRHRCVVDAVLPSADAQVIVKDVSDEMAADVHCRSRLCRLTIRRRGLNLPNKKLRLRTPRKRHGVTRKDGSLADSERDLWRRRSANDWERTISPLRSILPSRTGYVRELPSPICRHRKSHTIVGLTKVLEKVVGALSFEMGTSPALGTPLSLAFDWSLQRYEYAD